MRKPVAGLLLAAFLALAVGSVRGEQAKEKANFTDPEYQYTVTAPLGWSLFPASELPAELRALFFQEGPDGQQTGASLSVRVYPEQVHSDLDFTEFVGLYQLNIRSLGLEMEQISRHEYGSGVNQRISLDYTLEEDGQNVWYKQMFYRVGDDDVLLLSAKDLLDQRERSASDFNEFFDSVRIQASQTPAATPEPLDLPPPTELPKP
jgi:hypothetical protein